MQYLRPLFPDLGLLRGPFLIPDKYGCEAPVLNIIPKKVNFNSVIELFLFIALFL